MAKTGILTNGKIFKLTPEFMAKLNTEKTATTSDKEWTTEDIKRLLKTNKTFVIRSLIKMYNLQTEGEKNIRETTEHNGIGFNGADAKPLSGIAEQIITNNFITCKQFDYVQRKIAKYHKQLLKIANGQL